VAIPQPGMLPAHRVGRRQVSLKNGPPQRR